MEAYAHRQLPEGFARNLTNPPIPAAIPAPAATLALLRAASGGLEALLLRRSEETRFIPGAWVFPGGRLDAADADPDLTGRLKGFENLRHGAHTQGGPETPALDDAFPGAAFWSAAFRETFEETGLLLHATPRTPGPGRLAASRARFDSRYQIQEGELTFGRLLESLDVDLDAEAVAYIGHWVTPTTEPIRFDTRFFATEVPPDCPVYPDGTELVDALWLTPEEALFRNREGDLPMAFPTLVTLRELGAFPDPATAMRALANRPIPRLVPRLAPVPGGVRFLLGE
jgi:8-oxo-dGTP pyrophosphatase MutT (NUDIX family)